MKSIAKSQGGWRVIARVRVNKKIVQKSRVIQGSKEDAKAFLERLKTEIRTGGTVILGSLTNAPKLFKHIIEHYRENYKSRRGVFSRSHESNVNRLEKDLGGSEIIQFPNRFRLYIADFRVRGKNSQANRFIEIAKAAFQICCELELLKKNPITKKAFPRFKEVPRDNYLPTEEVTKIILTAAKNRRTCHLARALQYYFSVPCRRGEVVRMRIADIDLFRQRVRVHNGTTKNDQGIWKPIPPAMLKWFKCRVRESRSIEEPVFCRIVKGDRKNRRGGEVRVAPLGDFKNAWNTVREEAGHPKLRIHDSRHISATDMVNNGTPRTVVNAVAGWKTDMLKIYYHLDSDAALTHIRWPGESKREASVKLATEKVV